MDLSPFIVISINVIGFVLVFARFFRRGRKEKPNKERPSLTSPSAGEAPRLTESSPAPFLQEVKNQFPIVPKIYRPESANYIVGKIGEYLTEKHLGLHSEHFQRGDQINWIGFSLLHRGGDPNFDILNLRRITADCRRSGLCALKAFPCTSLDFFQKNFDADKFIKFQDVAHKKYHYYCATRNTKLLLDQYPDDKLSGSDKFIADYMACHYFIENYYFFLEKHNPEMYRKLKAGGPQIEEYFKGFPGRLDFLAKSSEQFYCIDSKVNSSRLSIWQQVRLSWMQKCGYVSQVFRHKIEIRDKASLAQAFTEGGCEAALPFVDAKLSISNYDPEKYPDAEALLRDTNSVVGIARSDYRWIKQ